VTEERKPQQAVGGQAVIEGVLMRTPNGVAIAVRQPDGAIVLRERPWQSWTKRFRPLGWPFIRGVVVLIESLKEGIDGLRFSAEIAVGEEEGGGGIASEGGSGRFTANLALLLGVVIALVLFKGVPHYIALWLGLDPTQTLFHVVDGVVKLVLIIGYITAISRMKDIQRVFQYHGAEHKSIRAFEEGSIWSIQDSNESGYRDNASTWADKVAPKLVEAAAGFSRLHERCGTSFIIVVVFASVLVYIAASPLIPRDVETGLLFQLALVGAKILLLAPVAALAYEINRLAGKYWRSPLARFVAWPGLLMQRLLTTREPSPEQLEVALAAMLSALAFTPDDSKGKAREIPWKTTTFESFEALVSEVGRGPGPAPGQPEAA
jgi:uncharacterized protein YqhQ